MIKEQKLFLIAAPILIGIALSTQYLTAEGKIIIKPESRSSGIEQEKKKSIVLENMTEQQIKEKIWENSKEISSCMTEKKDIESSLKEKRIKIDKISSQLQETSSINIFNLANWYDPVSIYKQVLKKRQEINDLQKRKKEVEKEIDSDESDLNKKSNQCQFIQADLEKLQKGIKDILPGVDIIEMISEQDLEDIERIKSDKIDLFISENQGNTDVDGILNLPPFSMPVNDYVVTSDFGYRIHPIYGTQKFHSGTDLGVDYGVPVSASNYGKVIYAGWYSGFGNTVVLSHAEGVYTLYGHNEKVLVKEGDIVRQGQEIALAGSTGNSTGPHCHFSMWVNNQLVNPMDYIQK